MNMQLLAELREYLTLKQHRRGRLQIKVDLGVRNHPQFSSLGNPAKDGVPGVLGVKFALFTQTITIDYDPAIIEPQLFDALFTATNPEELGIAVQALQNATKRAV